MVPEPAPTPTPVPPTTEPTPVPPAPEVVPPVETGPPPSVPTPSPSPFAPVPPPLAQNSRPAAPSAAAPAAVSASLNPSRAAARIGDSVPLSLVLMNLQGLEGLEVVLAYDPALLDAGEVKPGNLLTVDGAAVGVERTVEVGRVRARLTRPSGIAGSGLVASVAFRAIAAGPAEVRVESITLVTAGGVVQPAVPRPVQVTVSQ